MEYKNELYRIAEIVDEFMNNNPNFETEYADELETLLNVVFNRKVGECGS